MLASIIRRELNAMPKIAVALLVCFWFVNPVPVFALDSAEVLSPAEFISTVNANLLRSRGNEFTVRGTVARTSMSTRYTFFVYLQGPGFNTVGFRFYPLRDMLDSLSNIEPNDVVTLSGIVRDAGTLTDARVIAVEKNNPPFQIRPLYTEEEITELIRNRILLINGERLRFTGRVRRIDEGFGGYFLLFGDGWIDIRSVFDRQHRERLFDVNTGDTVTVEGTFRIWGGPPPFTQVGFFESVIIE